MKRLLLGIEFFSRRRAAGHLSTSFASTSNNSRHRTETQGRLCRPRYPSPTKLGGFA